MWSGDISTAGWIAATIGSGRYHSPRAVHSCSRVVTCGYRFGAGVVPSPDKVCAHVRSRVESGVVVCLGASVLNQSRVSSALPADHVVAARGQIGS